MDKYEIVSAEFAEGGDTIYFNVKIYLGGEQDSERPFSGSKIDADMVGELVKQSGEWTVKVYEVQSCEITDF